MSSTADTNNNTSSASLLGPLSRILGTWTGVGKGEYPTIEPFEYNETVKFEHNPASGKPIIAYSQKTTNAVTGKPMHAECGFLRVLHHHHHHHQHHHHHPDSTTTDASHTVKVELVLAHPNGLTSVEEGVVHILPTQDSSSSHSSLRLEMHLESTQLSRTTSAKHPHVITFNRVFTVDQDEMKYIMNMGTESTNGQVHKHLEARLHRS